MLGKVIASTAARSWGISSLALMILSMESGSVSAQIKHSYPRTAVFHFGRAVTDWYARFDLVMTPNRDVDFVVSIKARNPKTIVLPTSGWTAWVSKDKERFPAPTEQYWLARDSNGGIAGTEWDAYLVDLTNYCPRYQGKRYNEAFGDFILSLTDMDAFDGVASDWLWSKPHNITDIDLDRNGENDYVEHGEAWVERVWKEGVETLLSNLRNSMDPEKLILCNSGLFHSYGWQTTNGLILEHTSGIYSWDYFWRTYRDWMKSARTPHVLIMDGRPDGGDPNRPPEEKNYFRLMRFLLTATMLGDGYFSFTDRGAGEHHYSRYYDEFDLDIGFPTTEGLVLGNGCLVRFFDNGACITNPTGSPQTVTDSDLSSVSGYTGPYYRFKGGQDPDVNDGSRFDKIDLWGGMQGSKTLGDGIILVTAPTVSISDIVIDNLDYGTSPSNKPAILMGTWQQTDSGGNGYYIINRARSGWYPHAVASPGDGSTKATFQPNITVAGNYEVFEWHGNAGSGGMATNVPCTITYGDGSRKLLSIDQSSRQGRWNSLGVFPFTAGGQGQVELTNQTNGMVVADAVKFVFVPGGGESGDRTAPEAPTGVRIKNQ